MFEARAWGNGSVLSSNKAAWMEKEEDRRKTSGASGWRTCMFIRDFSDKAKAEGRFTNLSDTKRILACMEEDGATQVGGKKVDRMWTEDNLSRYIGIAKRLKDGVLVLLQMWEAYEKRDVLVDGITNLRHVATSATTDEELEYVLTFSRLSKCQTTFCRKYCAARCFRLARIVRARVGAKRIGSVTVLLLSENIWQHNTPKYKNRLAFGKTGKSRVLFLEQRSGLRPKFVWRSPKGRDRRTPANIAKAILVRRGLFLHMKEKFPKLADVLDEYELPMFFTKEYGLTADGKKTPEFKPAEEAPDEENVNECELVMAPTSYESRRLLHAFCRRLSTNSFERTLCCMVEDASKTKVTVCRRSSDRS